jgi:hypothetical protein
VKRTAPVDVDQDFEFVCDVTKSLVLPDGRRMVRGVASGIGEDQDGERVSANAIAKMAATSLAGGAVKITSSHDQDWLTEFGDVVKVEHDRANDELLIECLLPPEGEDPIADKAWSRLRSGEKLGFSIGGKLRKTYYELVERAGRVVKRKVLDEIDLRHVALTKKPSYRGTFAEAVAKTFTGDAPADDEFVDADDDVAKAAPTPPDDDAPQGAPAPGEGDPATDQPPAATGDTSPDAPSDAEAAQDLPEAVRHLSCPECGTEFAAPLPKHAGEAGTDDDPPDPEDDKGEARKSQAQEITMDTITDHVAKLRTLADTLEGTDVTKTQDTPVEPTEAVTTEPVEKTDGPSDIEKMVAASHRHSETEVAKLRDETQAGFGEVVKAIQGLTKHLAALPQGRKSVARVIPPDSEVGKTASETDDVAKRIEEADSPFEALKVLNEARGIK